MSTPQSEAVLSEHRVAELTPPELRGWSWRGSKHLKTESQLKTLFKTNKTGICVGLRKWATETGSQATERDLPIPGHREGSACRGRAGGAPSVRVS